ncbi:MAG: PTS sugar transporter subunit IIA [Desulfobacteraceae bacterium]|jgi:PTS system nitrogen regulatory IIA component
MALTINEVAARLKLPIETVHRWVRQGKIPMQRSGTTYSIRTEMLERWANEHRLEISDQSHHAMDESPQEPEFDSILLAMQRGGVFYDVEGDSRETALQSAVKRIPNVEPAEARQIYDKLLERELLASTGIGHGIALPHPRSNLDIALALPQITTCFLESKVAFGAIDGQPVNVLLVLLSHSTKQHLAMLSRLSYHLRDPEFRNHLLARPSEAEIFKRITALETQCD